MLSKLAQKLNKSLTGSRPNSPNNSPPREICGICKGRGCCNMCDRDDYWDNLVYCSNKNCNHVAHYACDNLTTETVKFIKHYYCPNCRLDGNFEVTFYAKTSTVKQKEIKNLLKIKNVQPSKNKPKKPNSKVKNIDTLEKFNLIPEDLENNDRSLSEELIVTEVMEFILNNLSDTQDVSTDKVSKPLKDIEQHYQSDHDIDSTSLSESETSVDNDSFLIEFPGQKGKDTDESNNKSTPKNSTLDKELLDDSSSSSQTSSLFDNQEKAKLIEIINVLTNKLQDENKQKRNMQKIIEGQEKEIMSLNRENLKFELELDEAEAVISRTDLELKTVKEEYNMLDNQFKELKFLHINPNEVFQYDPMDVFKFYKQEAILSKKKSVQVKCLQDENDSYKKNVLELKNDNADLRFKVRDLLEEDIDKKILNFTIEENRKLECKIKIQKERHVGMGEEYKALLEKNDELSAKNKSLEEKIKILEKNKNGSQMAGNVDNDWETISNPNSEPEVIIDTSPKTSSPNANESIENLLKKVLKKVEMEKNLTENKTNKVTPNESKPTSPNKQSSGVKTGQPNLKEKTVCKFYLQNRCSFGYKCWNFHPKNTFNEKTSSSGNFISPWNPNMYPNLITNQSNQTNFNPRLEQSNINMSQNFRVSPDRGRYVGYWSVPPIPTHQTRFSQLSEIDVNSPNDFPNLI